MTEQTSSTPPSDPPVRRLHRSEKDRWIAGVCGGIADYFRIDPVIVRVAAVALIFAGGAGVLLYLAAILLVPREGEEDQAPSGRAMTIAGVIVLAIAVGSLFSFHGPGGWIVLPLVVLGIAGLFAWQLASGERPGGDSRSILRAAGLGAALLAGCFLLAIGAGWAAGVGAGWVVASAVIVAGVAMVAGALTGHSGARWLILPALAVAIPAGIVSAAGVDLHGGIGDKTFRPSSSADVQGTYRVGIGRVRLDLRDARLTPGDHVVKLKAGVGLAELVVPRNVCVTTTSNLGVGGVEVFSRRSGGIDVAWHDDRTAVAGAPRVVLDGDVGIGGVRVTDRPDHAPQAGNRACV